MKKEKYDKPENVRKRNQEYRERMREKKMMYRCFWVPEDKKAQEKLKKFIDKLHAEFS